jgi:hypothetical protein
MRIGSAADERGKAGDGPIERFRVMARLTPMPITTASPARSSRIPASLALPERRSFGHLIVSGRPGAKAQAISCRAMAATRARVAGAGSPAWSRTSVLA